MGTSSRMAYQSLLICFAFGLLASAGLSRAGDPPVAVTPRGIEGCYHPTREIEALGTPLCLNVSPSGDNAERLTVGLVLGSQDADSVVQCRFQTVKLRDAGLTAKGCAINGFSVAFDGVFVASDPFLNNSPPDAVVLRGMFALESGSTREVVRDVEFTYDSGY